MLIHTEIAGILLTMKIKLNFDLKIRIDKLNFSAVSPHSVAGQGRSQPIHTVFVIKGRDNM